MKFYDHGWNDRCDGKSCPFHATRDYKDGWQGCNDASPEQRVKI